MKGRMWSGSKDPRGGGWVVDPVTLYLDPSLEGQCRRRPLQPHQRSSRSPILIPARFPLELIGQSCFAATDLEGRAYWQLCSEHGPICHLFELILVIHVNTSNGTNHFVEHVFVGISRSHGCYHMLTYHAQVNIPCPS
jgi:hypothetical protein